MPQPRQSTPTAPTRWLRAATILVALVAAAPRSGLAAPITSGTIFLDPDIITASDPNAFLSVSFDGIGPRLMFDRRIDAFQLFDAYLFTASYSDGLETEIQINPEFDAADAAAAALEYGTVLGLLPTALRTDMQSVWIHQGVQPFGGGNDSVLIHTGQAGLYAADGILEETLVHEAAHTSLDATHAAAPGWLAAQLADNDFISTYAMDFPLREDVAESFLPWLAARHRPDRISAALAQDILSTIPNRVAYFDRQDFDLFPVTQPVPEPSSVVLLSTAVGLFVRRRIRRARR
jgi:hypothetical protein